MKATLTVLGSGTSMGVPTIGCDCAVCRSDDARDRRLRPSVLLEFADRHVLIDTTPDFREQAIRAGIRKLDAVLYTHGHADHILGLDDLRPLSFRHPGRLPLYADAHAARSLRETFGYIFDEANTYASKAQVVLNHIDDAFDLFGARIEPVRVMHGDDEIHGFRFGNAAYLTDFSDIPAASKPQLRGLDILFLDALRHKPHPTHSTVENSLKLVEELAPKRAFFTHISHDLPHEETNAGLPPHVRLAHDGLKLEFEI
ncbi:MAG: MBL fold metallo-hydrolase [Candidatus Koribacter versatilis]|uniref:MBL fold metallo-hydrolase n=1 Tax=Candidatus Korobacter versatilis TaxID=658062 RepID=A0A932EQ39_9BACT|nr:MBL fold metallo-hydrolase [Candidatus Koribacter versatilis]